MASFPPTISDPIGGAGTGVFTGKDTAKYVVARSRFVRPTLSVPGGPSFEWPVGLEGFVISGAPTLSSHKYIGDNAPVVEVTHLDDRKITLSGVFPGHTSNENMNDLLDVITAVTPAKGKILTLPGLLPKQQTVVVEDYSFEHDQEERTQDIAYTVSFSRTGVAAKVKAPRTATSPLNPVGTTAKPKGKAKRVYTVHAGGRTLRAAAKLVFGNANKWAEIYSKNTKALNALGVPLHSLPTKNLPLGMKLFY